jgi:hypothetical protein
LPAALSRPGKATDHDIFDADAAPASDESGALVMDDRTRSRTKVGRRSTAA